MKLPAAIAPHGSVRALKHDVEQVISARWALAGHGVRVLALFVLSSWIVELLPAATCLRIHGAFGDAVEVLRFLGALCRHALVLGNVDHRTFYRLPIEALQPTVLAAQVTTNAATVRTIRASNRRGLLLPSSAALSDQFCCKAFWAGDFPLEATGAISVTVLPASHPTYLSEHILCATAASLQPKLLNYRWTALLGQTAFKPSAAGASAPSPPTADAGGLLAAALDDQEIRSEALESLAGQIAERAVDPEMLERSVVIEACLAACHEEGRMEVHVGQLADDANLILLGRGENRQLHARRFGTILRSVGLFTSRLGSSGRGIVLTQDVRRAIHRLAFSFKVGSPTSPIACPCCREFIHESEEPIT